jgi:predicted transcriptional regulator
MPKINLKDVDSSDPRLEDDSPDPVWWEDEKPGRNGYGHKAVLPPASEGTAQRESIEDLFDAAMAGFLPRSRELKPWEPDKLNPRHLQIINLKAAGVSNTKIAEMLGIGETNVSIIVNHPDSKYLLARIVAYAAENVTDIRARIEASAALAHEKLMEVLTTSTKEDSIIKVGFGLLDRAGYGAVQKSESKVVNEIHMAKEEASLISQAIRESSSIEEAEYVILPEEQPPGSPGSIGSDGGHNEQSLSEDASTPPASGSQDQLRRTG